jgi:hypothetical protein
MISPRMAGKFSVHGGHYRCASNGTYRYRCAIPLLEPLSCYAEFKVYKCVAKFDANSENRRRFAFSCRHYSSVARPPSKILERRDVLKECKR